MFRIALVVAVLVLSSLVSQGGVAAGIGDPVNVEGARRLLVVAVRFPGVDPGRSLENLRKKAASIDRYVRRASYGKTWLKPRVVGWYEMPARLDEYRVSPYNFKVDRGRVRRLIADALGAARRDADIAAFDLVWIVVGAFTEPGKGYGMIAYAANPGMLSGVRKGRVRLETVRLTGGGSFAGAAVVSAVNAHVGHVAHDLLHALGGATDGVRAVPDLYDFDLQSNPPGRPMTPAMFAIHAGPWDIMSQHFIERRLPPPQPSSFTRLQLGWIAPNRVATVRPGETRKFTLAPLSDGGALLAVRVPLSGGRYLLLENRQARGADAVLPAGGLLVLEVDPAKEEGAGIVKVADANPGVPGLMAAPFRPRGGERRHYENRSAGVAVVPLAVDASGNLRLVVTTPERAAKFLHGSRN